MTSRKPRSSNDQELHEGIDMTTIAPKHTAGTYVKGSHTAGVRVDHDERRTALLARDEVLAGEIQRRQDERDDINEALRLLSDPGESNVVPLTSAAQ